MAVRPRDPTLRIVRWPTADWYHTPVGYRFIKRTFQKPITALARIRSQGAHHLPDSGPVILAVNHLTWADPIVLGAIIHRPAFYLAKEGLFRNPAMKWFLETMGQIKVERVTGGNDDAIATAVKLLDQGLVLGIFPEGTRSREGEVKRGKTGVARIAALSGAPIIPVGLATSDFWPRDSALFKPGRTNYINIGAPMRFDLKPGDAENKERMREVTDEVMDRIRQLFHEATDAQRRDLPWRNP